MIGYYFSETSVAFLDTDQNVGSLTWSVLNLKCWNVLNLNCWTLVLINCLHFTRKAQGGKSSWDRRAAQQFSSACTWPVPSRPCWAWLLLSSQGAQVVGASECEPQVRPPRAGSRPTLRVTRYSPGSLPVVFLLSRHKSSGSHVFDFGRCIPLEVFMLKFQTKTIYVSITRSAQLVVSQTCHAPLFLYWFTHSTNVYWLPTMWQVFVVGTGDTSGKKMTKLPALNGR